MDFNTGYQRGFLKWTREHWLRRADPRIYGSGRAAFLDLAVALSSMGVKRLWIPAWQCGELMISLQKVHALELRFYEVDDDLVPSSGTIQKLDPNQDALLVVDYFASVGGAALLRSISEFKGQILLDAVHSWLLSDVSRILPGQLTVVSGFRKLFWKAAGAIVTGELVSKLPIWPSLSLAAAPAFPQNLSLRPRFGFLSTSVLLLLNLGRYDEIARKWPIDAARDGLLALRSPVGLAAVKDGAEGWLWPDLWKQMPLPLQRHAEQLKQYYRVIQR
jgi:hypothetical protein